MNRPPHVTRETFLANARRSGLLSAEQLRSVAGQLPDTHRGRVVARSLVGLGVLTRFQAEQLLAGRIRGFQLGQYRILDQLGQGGMGRVFKAEHTTMGRTVALKVLGPNLVRTERARDLFRREVRAAARLNHPHIVTAYDASEAGGRHYLVLEYVDGPNLEQLVRDRGPLPVGLACELARQAALGLQHAHELGMVHRDVKPANLLLARTGGGYAVKVSDFGLARLGAGEEAGTGTIETRPNTVLGTPDYLSPEQARNMHLADIRSDLYSLGCTLYYLLTHSVPYPGGTSLEKLVRHATVEVPSVADLRPEVPSAVVALVRRLMAKDPADRFATPAEAAAALAPFCDASVVPWATAPATSPFAGLTAASGGNTPAPHQVRPEPAEEDLVLLGTLPPGAELTPVSAIGMGSGRRLHEEGRRGVGPWAALVASVAIIGALVGLAALVAW